MRGPSILVLGAAIVLAVAACSSAGGSAGTGAPAGSVTSAAPGGGGYGAGDGGGGYGASDASASAPAAGGACTPSTAAGTVEVGIQSRSFGPSTVEAKVGDVIAFTNSDGVSHTATLDDGSCTTEALGQGETGALTFSAAGTYPFHCRIHPDMTGTFEIAG